MTEKTCASHGCGKPLVRAPKESTYDFRRRQTCGRSCAGKLQPGMVAPIHGRKCANPACSNILEPRHHEGPRTFNARTCCCPDCGMAVARMSRMHRPREHCEAIPRRPLRYPHGYRYQDITWADIEMWK